LACRVRKTACVWALMLLGTPLLAAQALPGAPLLGLPLQCMPGVDCWIANLMDLDPGAGVRDYACGRLTYDKHDGIDFALRDDRAMQEGVPVVAAAAGVVRAVRDEEPDVSVRDRTLSAVAGRECGNGLRIDHGSDLQTQYCHLRRGSLRVRRGERVEAGQPLGLVGLSGQTEYPHLHFVVRRSGRPIDPFTRVDSASACPVTRHPLWNAQALQQLSYATRILYNFGVADGSPKAADVRSGRYRSRSLSPQAPVLAVWLEAFGVSAGDVVDIEVLAPDGAALLHHRSAIERDQARIFRLAGRKRKASGWPSGLYRIRISISPRAGSPGEATRVNFTAEVGS